MKKGLWFLISLVLIMASLLPVSAGAMDDFWGGIGGWACCDTNGNGGCEVGEPSLYNVLVRVGTPGVDGLCGSKDDVVYRTIPTDYSGEFFLRLPEGQYCLSFGREDNSVLEGMEFIEGEHGPQPFAFNLREAEFKVSWEVGYAKVSGIFGFVFHDKDANSRYDGRYEPLVGGSSIEAWRDKNLNHSFDDSQDELAAEVPVNSTGWWNIPDLLPGKYFLRIISQEGWGITTAETFYVALWGTCGNVNPGGTVYIFGINQWKVRIPLVFRL